MVYQEQDGHCDLFFRDVYYTILYYTILGHMNFVIVINFNGLTKTPTALLRDCLLRPLAGKSLQVVSGQKRQNQCPEDSGFHRKANTCIVADDLSIVRNHHSRHLSDVLSCVSNVSTT